MFWSPDSKHFAITRSDARAVKDLWVINSVSEPSQHWKPTNTGCPVKKMRPSRVCLFFRQRYKKLQGIKYQTI